jgi:hypothetical protein
MEFQVFAIENCGLFCGNPSPANYPRKARLFGRISP